jgi:predicted chitinase
MDGATLNAVMGRNLPSSYVDAFNQALIAANCTTVNRAAMFIAQTGHESGGLLWLEELASGSEYQGRSDLGNTKPGFGVRYKGRGIIQCTGAVNYSAFSRWAHSQGMVPTATYFYDNPTAVAQLPWAFISASWYWTVARPNLNAYADAGNTNAATRAVNGGLNGYDDRVARWNRALKFGTKLLPSGSSGDVDMTPAQAQQLQDLHDRLARVEAAWGGGYTDEKGSPYDLMMFAKRDNVAINQIWGVVNALSVKVDRLINAAKA